MNILCWNLFKREWTEFPCLSLKSSYCMFSIVLLLIILHIPGGKSSKGGVDTPHVVSKINWISLCCCHNPVIRKGKSLRCNQCFNSLLQASVCSGNHPLSLSSSPNYDIVVLINEVVFLENYLRILLSYKTVFLITCSFGMFFLLSIKTLSKFCWKFPNKGQVSVMATEIEKNRSRFCWIQWKNICN